MISGKCFKRFFFKDLKDLASTNVKMALKCQNSKFCHEKEMNFFTRILQGNSSTKVPQARMLKQNSRYSSVFLPKSYGCVALKWYTFDFEFICNFNRIFFFILKN